MEVNRPDILAEVKDAFFRYEKALVTNDVAVLDELFFASEHTIRYGAGENLYGFDAISQFRAARSTKGLERRLEGTILTTFGADFATAMTLFHREEGKVGRQSQTWVRMPEGWRIVAAHVSVISVETL